MPCPGFAQSGRSVASRLRRGRARGRGPVLARLPPPQGGSGARPAISRSRQRLWRVWLAYRVKGSAPPTSIDQMAIAFAPATTIGRSRVCRASSYSAVRSSPTSATTTLFGASALPASHDVTSNRCSSRGPQGHPDPRSLRELSHRRRRRAGCPGPRPRDPCAPRCDRREWDARQPTRVVRGLGPTSPSSTTPCGSRASFRTSSPHQSQRASTRARCGSG